MTRVAFPEHDTTIPCQMAKSNAPRTFFRFFFGGAAGRAGGWLWPLWVGGKEKPPSSADFRRDADSGGKLRRGYRRLTTPPCVLKHHAPWWVGAHITYIMPPGCQAILTEILAYPRCAEDRPYGVGIGHQETFRMAFSGRLAALRSILLYNTYSALSSFARH